MSNSHFAHAVGHAFREAKGMPPVGSGKNPLIGFVMGFFFGPIGVGLYLRSVGDFFLSLAMVLMGAFFTAGLATPVFWVLCGAWAYTRIKNSNEQQGGSN